MSLPPVIADIPRDGTEVRVRIGTRWFTGAWAYNAETGGSFFGVRLGGSSGAWQPIALDVIGDVKLPRSPSPASVAKESPRQPPAAALVRAVKTTPLITIEEVAGRVVAMVLTLRFMADSEARFLTAGGRINWPAAIYTPEDIRAQAENHENRDSALRPARHKPSPADLARLDETWGWFSALEPLDLKTRRYLIRGGRLPLSPSQHLIWKHVLGASFRTIAKDTGEHHETIRNRYIRAIERLHAIADAARERELRAAADRRAAASRRAG